VTYRMGAHTNSDDPTRYVPPEALQEWKQRDPIERFREQLRGANAWDDERHAAMVEVVDARLERIIASALAWPVDPAAALDHLSATSDARVTEQRAEIVHRAESGKT